MDAPVTAQPGHSMASPQYIRGDVKVHCLGRSTENTKELDSRLNNLNCIEADQVPVKGQPAQDELGEFAQAFGNCGGRESTYQRLRKRMDTLKKLNDCKWRWGSEHNYPSIILETESSQLWLVVTELDKAHRKITRMHKELNRNVLATQVVLMQWIDELPERLKSRDARLYDTLDAGREVGGENLCRLED